MNDSRIKDPTLWPRGKERTAWASRQMPVLAAISHRFATEKPLAGLRVGACLHISAKTANLVLTLKAGGSEVFLCGSNPLSTQDDIAAFLAQEGFHVYAWRGEGEEDYQQNLRMVLSAQPDLLVDDGADLTVLYHEGAPGRVCGGTEETTTGVTRLQNLERQETLRFPLVAVNSAQTKHLFDNRYGTGQSALDGVLRATNLLIAGSVAVICGYGWVGRGIANRVRGLGANVIVTEVNPVRAMEAHMDGLRVMPISEAAPLGDLFISATGDTQVISASALPFLKDGAILANAGHFNVEIDLPELRRMSASSRRVTEHIEEFIYPDGRHVYLLGEGRLVNLACGEGHPAGVMDLSFADQALALEYLSREHASLPARVLPFPEAIDEEVARLKLAALGVRIDSLSEVQERYLASYHID
jgi:adenosylhomocysteinase